jgi:hypothetical protein
MKRLYERAAQLLRPTGLELGEGENPRMIRALRLAAEEIYNKAQYAPGGYGPTVPIADFDEAVADVIKIVRRHVFREVLGKEV